MNNRSSIIILSLYLLVMHSAFIIEATIDTYDLIISLGIVIISIFVYKTTNINNNKWINWLGCIILAGSVSNCIDEICTNNTEKRYSEILIWGSLCIYLIKINIKNVKI